MSNSHWFIHEQQKLLTYNFNLFVRRTHTHTFNGTNHVSWYQKGKTNLDFAEARDSERRWHQLAHMQVCISLRTDNHASTTPLKFFTGRMPFLPPNQQHQTLWSIWYCNIISYENLSLAYHGHMPRHLSSKIYLLHPWYGPVASKTPEHNNEVSK